MTDAKLPGLEERFAEIKGVRMRYFVGGEGPPLVLVHGLGGAASNWTELAPLLRGRRLLVPDLPGHGGSSALPGVSGLEPFADRVAAVAEREAVVAAPGSSHSPATTRVRSSRPCAAPRSCSGALRTHSCRSTTRSSTRGGCGPACASSPAAATCSSARGPRYAPMRSRRFLPRLAPPFLPCP